MKIYKAILFMDSLDDIREEAYFKSRDKAIKWLREKYVDEVWAGYFSDEPRGYVESVLINYLDDPEDYQDFVKEHCLRDMRIITDYSECIENSICTWLDVVRVID